jgi:hypothetical protein
MFRWFKHRREVLHAREAQWLTARVAGPNGLSDFQRRAEEALGRAGFALNDRAVLRSIRSPSELSVTGTVSPSNSQVIFYADAAEIRLKDGDVVFFEECDKGSPNELISQLVARVRELVAHAS